MTHPFRALPQAPREVPPRKPSPSVVVSVKVPPRRGFLGILAAVAVTPAAAATTLSADAGLIQICDAHPTVLKALDEHGSGEDDCPFWLAYVRSRDAIHTAVPVTLAGIVAKARAAKAEVFNPGSDTENPHGTVAETWAWDLVQDLLRLDLLRLEGTL
ncbi:hypothetical protein D9599_25875 [Roseomonas sp. KE2513]|uniref:hypothetical protein n=1 Tax=Roseomonas sp. KE2513 TaxID=2479202 RepID=UPI0018DFC342|nr:hypothetical protein [Roseomonas sp. KE2513]MBI0538985.1 hypothetical protein [Roseomonas sp. KE2513]